MFILTWTSASASAFIVSSWRLKEPRRKKWVLVNFVIWQKTFLLNTNETLDRWCFCLVLYVQCALIDVWFLLRSSPLRPWFDFASFRASVKLKISSCQLAKLLKSGQNPLKLGYVWRAGFVSVLPAMGDGGQAMVQATCFRKLTDLNWRMLRNDRKLITAQTCFSGDQRFQESETTSTCSPQWLYIL